MSIRKTIRVQDSVHGLMEFHGMETGIIQVLSTPEIQRLRRIRQLGLANMVFPGAEHSRFSHSLGAAYLAIRFGRMLRESTKETFPECIGIDESVVRDLGLAAMFHDLGHGPFSHAFEREIVGKKWNREAWMKAMGLELEPDKLNQLQWHELVGLGLLGWKDGELHKMLEGQEVGLSRRIMRMLQGEYYLPYLPRLIASDLDIDRADFIRRDTHQTGVAYGRYDLEWLISTATIGQTTGKNPAWVVGFHSQKALRVVEQFVIARRAMYETVYHHKTVRCAEGMMALFLRRIREAFPPRDANQLDRLTLPLVRIIQGETIGPEEILHLDDFAMSVLVEGMAANPNVDFTLRDLADKLRARHLFKEVNVSQDDLAAFFERDDSRKLMNEAVSKYCKDGDPNYYWFEDHADFKLLSEEEDQKIYLILPTGEAKPYESISMDAFAGQINKTHRRRLFVLREASKAVEKCIREVM